MRAHVWPITPICPSFIHSHHANVDWPSFAALVLQIHPPPPPRCDSISAPFPLCILIHK